jgi:hypothetical protein
MPLRHSTFRYGTLIVRYGKNQKTLRGNLAAGQVTSRPAPSPPER